MSTRTDHNRARYDRAAAVYEWLVRRGSLGQFSHFYRAVAGAIEADPGALLLDVGCGPGTLTPHLLPKVGPAGQVVGLDLSDAMIERARSRAAREGWPNVRFERTDVRDFSPERPAGIVVLCLSLTTMPDPLRCFCRALSWLEPGGQLVLLDSFLAPERSFANLAIRLKSGLVGAEPAAVSRAELASRLDRVRVRGLLGGVYTLLCGRRPRDSSRARGSVEA